MAQPDSRDFAAEIAGGPASDPEVVEPRLTRPDIKVSFKDAFRNNDTTDECPEQFLMDTMAMRPRSMSHHLSSTKVPSRKWLVHKARFWRFLMSFGMVFHDWAPPKAPKPSFIKSIYTDTEPIDLYFYVPKDYQRRKKVEPGYRYPLVVNFHGGGFCLGHATDDRYWARIILKETPAIFISVNYRRAPEHPFPQPVDDCVEALLWIQSHAEELHLDPGQIALSGFSAGGNLAFTVPFRLTYQYDKQPSREHLPLPQRKDTSNFVPEPGSPDQLSPSDREEHELGTLTPFNEQATPFINRSKPNSPYSSILDLSKTNTNRTLPFTNNSSRTNLLNLPGPRSNMIRTITEQSHISTVHSPYNRSTTDIASQDSLSTVESGPRIRVVSILAWYPLLDWTSSRAEKKRGSRNPKKTLPAVFTDLFDFSYLPAPDHEGHHCSPYASPALAPDHMIVDGLPLRIQMWLCEWDMLLAEGEKFSQRLSELGKDVKTEMIPGVPHGWDKSPNPFRNQKKTDVLYRRAAGYLNSVFRQAERRATVGEGIGLGGMR
ncbi:hypothetical protein H2198_004021 [Neophaeococcomyces mojaviensis]|uniref:Uncharacterized protein n=1 Tax=Neophaeococcomyces mojaviensis TaxID=3383035 RepID=A0ACC3A9S8_9EURO|nr:hypothetical protein H2198_004021 [Knufia sp. JES_112]